MLKKLLVAVAAVTGGLAATSAMAAPTFKCAPTVLQVPGSGSNAQFMIDCSAAGESAFAPTVTVAGELPTTGTPPYLVTASYKVDSRSGHAQRVSTEAAADQVFSGKLLASTTSLASLPTEIAERIQWDAGHSILSIEDLPGVWSIFSVSRLDLTGDTIAYAGQSSTPFANGTAVTLLELGKQFSRFAGKGADQAVIKARLAIRNGKIEVLVGETRGDAQDAIKNALIKLDKRPKDIARAWQLGAQAKFLGLEDEVQYAVNKVAAHNPQLVAEFEMGIARITPYTLLQPMEKKAK